ncbi:hypothetical protein BDV06DRAFT_216187 [Aspergillus oleicola]
MSFTLNPPLDSLLARQRQLSRSAAVRANPLCLGAMTFGTANSELYGHCTKDDAFAALDTFYSQGGNFIDTANAYSEGYQKFGNNNVKPLKVALYASLARLGTSYIDFYYVHWWDYTTSIPELMHALNDFVVSGKVLYFSISDTLAWIKVFRQFNRDIIPMFRKGGMGLFPYTVLNQGRFQTEEGFREREKHNKGRNFTATTQRYEDVSRVLENIAKKKNVDLLHITLGYVMDKAPYMFPIVGARKVSHIEGMIAGIGVALDEDEISEIESVYEFDSGFHHSFLSGTLFDQSKSRGADHPSDVWFSKPMGNFD